MGTLDGCWKFTVQDPWPMLFPWFVLKLCKLCCWSGAINLHKINPTLWISIDPNGNTRAWRNACSRLESSIEHTTLAHWSRVERDMPYPREFHSVHVMLALYILHDVTTGNYCRNRRVVTVVGSFDSLTTLLWLIVGHNLYAVIKRWSANGSVLMCVLFQNYCFLSYLQNNIHHESVPWNCRCNKATRTVTRSYVVVALVTRHHYC